MSVAEASAAVPLRDRTNPAPQDPSGHALGDGAGPLLRTILEHHRELGLDGAQIGELSRLYWSAPQPAAAETIEAVERTLSSEQFRKCIAYLASGSRENEATGPPSADIGALITAAIEERTKDKDMLAVDLAAKAADRLMTWMRMLGFFVGLPMAVLLAGLSAAGISKFQDVRDIGTRADATLQAAQAKLDAAAQRSTAIDVQLAKLDQRVATNDQRINSLDSTVRTLAEKLNFGAAADLPDSLRIKLEQDAAGFRRYFEKLGYTPNTETINISTKVDVPGGISYYEADSNTIFIQSGLADDETLLFHEYAHHILYSSLSFDAVNGNPEWKYSAFPIEYGLDNYFIASFRKWPSIGALAARRLGPNSGVALPYNLKNTKPITATQLGDTRDDALIGRLQLAWAGAFWELRQKLHQDVTDKCLYEAWRALADQDQALVAHSFIANLAPQLDAAAGKPAVKILREILARRGVSGADLPNAG